MNSVVKKRSNVSIMDNSIDLYNKILQEKENYIMRLENEINEMRKEIENLKEKLI